MSSERTAAPRWLVIAAFAAVYLIWGSTYLAIRYAIETIPPFLMAGSRFLIAGLILYTWVRLRGGPAPERVHWRSGLLLGGLFLLGGNGGVVWAEQRVPSGVTALIVATVVAWTVLIDWVRPRGERPRLGTVLGLVIGFVGVAILVLPGGGLGGSVDPIGAAVLVLASFSWANGSVFSKQVPQPSSPAMASATQMLAGGALLTLAGVVSGELGRIELAHISSRSIFAVLYLIGFGSLIGFSAFAWLLRVTTPARVSTYAYVNPVVAVLLGWAVAGEVMSGRILIAALVIVAAVVLITTARGQPRAPARVPAPGGERATA